MITLSKEGCARNGASLDEAILLLAYCNKVNLKEAHDKLLKKGYITKEYNITEAMKQEWRVTQKGIELIDAIIVDSPQEDEDPLIEIAKELKKIFPKGKKEGTNKYWAEGEALIVRRLKLFFKKYGKNFTKEQIITAANNYVSSFNGNYKPMRTLKYFILKEVKGVSNDIESSSDLLTYIENENETSNNDRDWTAILV